MVPVLPCNARIPHEVVPALVPALVLAQALAYTHNGPDAATHLVTPNNGIVTRVGDVLVALPGAELRTQMRGLLDSSV